MAALDYSVFGRIDDADNKPISGGKLRIYDADTTNLSSVYSNPGLTVGLTNPVVADSAGRLPPIFIAAGTYDLALLTAADASVDAFDDYTVADLTGLDDILFPVLAKTADYTLADGDSGSVLEVNADSAVGSLITITSEAGDRGNGFLVSIVNIGTTGTVLISPDVGETIDGLASVLLTAGQGLIMVSRGASGWRIISRKEQTLVLPQGRLTLATATPVLTSDQTAKTSLFYTPYLGKFIPIWNGFEWVTTPFSELTLAFDSDSGHSNYHQSGKNFDCFVVNDGGTVRLGTGPAWTSDTGRGTGAGTTELNRTNGLLANAVSMTLRFGSSSGNTVVIAAGKATYVGSVRMTSNGQTAWVAAPAAAGGGGACTLYLWNMYNRVLVSAVSRDSDNSWAYTTLTWRAANAGGTGSGLNNRVSMLMGLSEDSIRAVYSVSSIASSGSQVAYAGVGLDSATAPSGMMGAGGTDTGALTSQTTGVYEGPSGLGLHYVQALEAATASGTRTWYGDNNAAFHQMGLTLTTRM